LNLRRLADDGQPVCLPCIRGGQGLEPQPGQVGPDEDEGPGTRATATSAARGTSPWCSTSNGWTTLPDTERPTQAPSSPTPPAPPHADSGEPRRVRSPYDVNAKRFDTADDYDPVSAPACLA
jgi:hypothetical protein